MDTMGLTTAAAPMPMDTIPGFIAGMKSHFETLLAHSAQCLPESVERWRGFVAAAEAVGEEWNGYETRYQTEVGRALNLGADVNLLNAALRDIRALSAYAPSEDDRRCHLAEIHRIAGNVKTVGIRLKVEPPAPANAEAEQGMANAVVSQQPTTINDQPSDATVGVDSNHEGHEEHEVTGNCQPATDL